MTPSRTIAIDLFDGAEELDVIGPWEVLAHWTQTYPEDGWICHLATDDGLPRTCAKGLRLSPTVSWEELDAPRVLVEPGGHGSRQRMTDAAYLDRVRRLTSADTLVTSVCTGAYVLAKAGLLKDRPATTHHYRFEELLAIDPTIELRRGERFVDDGDIVTAAGVSAGIDMALHLVGRLASPSRAAEVRAGIEYFPAATTPASIR